MALTQYAVRSMAWLAGLQWTHFLELNRILSGPESCFRPLWIIYLSIHRLFTNGLNGIDSIPGAY